MNTAVSEHQAFKKRIRDEKWQTFGLQAELRRTLTANSLATRFGGSNYHHSNSDTFKLSKFDLKKLLTNQRRRPNAELTQAQKEVVDSLNHPTDSQSTMIWNDTSYRQTLQSYNENLLVGKAGNFSFDNDMQRWKEKLWQENIDKKQQNAPLNSILKSGDRRE